MAEKKTDNQRFAPSIREMLYDCAPRDTNKLIFVKPIEKSYVVMVLPPPTKSKWLAGESGYQ